jgi:hypothetical protein
MVSKDWSVIAESDNCVLVKIKEGVDLNGLELILKDDCRIPIVKLKLETYEVRICTYTGKPMFAEIGHSVKYVDKSGSKAYL